MASVVGADAGAKRSNLLPCSQSNALASPILTGSMFIDTLAISSQKELYAQHP